MSVRKVYSVIVGGDCVYSGPFATAMAVYESFEAYRSVAPGDFPEVLVCFKPILKGE